MTRAETKHLIARQVAIFNGQQFEKLALKPKLAMLTLAESILATVERSLATQKIFEDALYASNKWGTWK